ncbi:DUF1127 domain-containing protein [Ochrobactrum sp. BD61]
MTVQCQSASSGKATTVRSMPTWTVMNGPSWLLELRSKIQKQLQIWAYEGRVRRSRRVLEALPEHILHDIGWPNVDDRLPGIPRNQGEFQRRN